MLLSFVNIDFISERFKSNKFMDQNSFCLILVHRYLTFFVKKKIEKEKGLGFVYTTIDCLPRYLIRNLTLNIKVSVSHAKCTYKSL